MKQFDLIYNEKNIGKVILFTNNLNNNLKNSLVITKSNIKYNIITIDSKMQQYEVYFIINDMDDLIGIVSKYKYNEKEIFEEIDNIKKYNNIKNIKNNTNIKIILSEIYLDNLKISKEDIDQTSVFMSKIYFVNKIVDDKIYTTNKLEDIINNYNKYKNSSEYEFLTKEEHDIIMKKYNSEIDSLIDIIEYKTQLRYGKDFIIPIKINNGIRVN